MGYTLPVGNVYQQIFAPTTHGLPVVRCPSSADDLAIVQLAQAHGSVARLNCLQQLSPLYSSIWHDGPVFSPGTAEVPVQKTDSSFRIVSAMSY